MISVRGLTRRYGNFVAVDNVSFDIAQGEIVGLLGHNGAGKTSLMKILTGYLEADAGDVLIDGLDMASQRRAIQQKIGYLPENCPVYPEMTVIDYLRYAARLHGLSGTMADRAVRRAIELTELNEKATSLISTLSRGLRQRVGVSQAILHEPQILILDEPTNGLDPSQIHHMRDLIRTLAEKSTVIVSTHILQEVQAVCSRVLIMRRGSKVLDEKLADLRHIGRLILEVNASEETLQSMLKDEGDVASVAYLDQNDGFSRYALTLVETAQSNQAAVRMARLLHERGIALAALHPEVRDLETIFGELNAEKMQGGVAA